MEQQLDMYKCYHMHVVYLAFYIFHLCMFCHVTYNKSLMTIKYTMLGLDMSLHK